jgi:Kef-type K+ transport system membrane component KefB
VWSPRWGDEVLFTNDIWSFAGTVGVTLLIMESGMHINFEKVKLIGGKAFVVAIIGTAAPMVMGMLLVAALFPGKLYPEGFAAGCALAPTSVGISIQLP